MLRHVVEAEDRGMVGSATPVATIIASAAPLIALVIRLRKCTERGGDLGSLGGVGDPSGSREG